MSNRLLIVTALVEVGTGFALLFAPSLIVEILLGEGLTSLPSLVLARITGAALIAIGVACWLASRGESRDHRALVGGTLLYNVAVPALLMHAAVAFGLRGILLGPAAVLHTGLAIWCVLCLWRR